MDLTSINKFHLLIQQALEKNKQIIIDNIEVLSIKQEKNVYNILFSVPFIYNDVCEFKVKRSWKYRKCKYTDTLISIVSTKKTSDIAIRFGVKKHFISENNIDIKINIENVMLDIKTKYYTISNDIEIVKKFREHKLNKLINE